MIGGICWDRYHRVEVLGALASVLSTWLVTGILLYEAVFRIISPVPVNGKGDDNVLLIIFFARLPTDKTRK